MMQPENEGTSFSPTRKDATKTDEEAALLQADDSHDHGNNENGDSDNVGDSPPGVDKSKSAEGFSLDKLMIQAVATFQFLKRELPTMDAAKAKRWGGIAKDKALVLALTLKVIMLQYFDELKKMDQEKARALGAKYQVRAKELGGKVGAKAVELAGAIKVNGMEAVQALQTMDREEAKAKGSDMYRRAKIAYGAMSPATKLKYAFLLLLGYVCFNSMFGTTTYTKNIQHKRLCYVKDEIVDPTRKLDECEAMLEAVTRAHSNWIFLGNQPLFATYALFGNHEGRGGNQPLQRQNGDKGKRRKVRFFYNYDLPDADVWAEKYGNPAKSKEIAARQGLGQTDCGSCNMVTYNNKKNHRLFDGLAVETSRDVSQATDTTKTTQETIDRYLKDKYPEKKDNVCVLQQTGTYEMKMAPHKTVDQYIAHTKDFHKLLEAHCDVFIRMGMFKDTTNLQAKVEQWSLATRDLVLQSSNNNAFFIDVSHVTNPSEKFYYRPTFEMFSRLSKALEK